MPEPPGATHVPTEGDHRAPAGHPPTGISRRGNALVSSSARYRRASARAASRTASSASALSNPRGLGDDVAIARYDDGGRGPHRRAFGYAEGVLVSLLHDETRSVRAREKAPKEGWRTKRKTSETATHTKPRIWKVMGKNLAPSSSHVCLSRFEAARGFPPPAHPAIALLPVHNTPRRQQSRWLLPSLPSASSLPRRSRPSVASRSARARPVRPSRSRHPRPSARVWIEPTRKADARRDFDGASPTSRPARPPALARDSYARLPARAPHARALLIAPWLTASLPALGSARGASPSPPPSQPRLPARRPAA